MNFSEIFRIIKAVLLNPYVIGTAIFILLYLNFVSFVAKYTKKPPKPKKKKVVAPPPTQEKTEGEEDEENDEKEDEKK
jgi:hypothetical protein